MVGSPLCWLFYTWMPSWPNSAAKARKRFHLKAARNANSDSTATCELLWKLKLRNTEALLPSADDVRRERTCYNIQRNYWQYSSILFLPNFKKVWAHRHRSSKLCRLTHGQVVHISTLADSVRRCKVRKTQRNLDTKPSYHNMILTW